MAISVHVGIWAHCVLSVFTARGQSRPRIRLLPLVSFVGKHLPRSYVNGWQVDTGVAVLLRKSKAMDCAPLSSPQPGSWPVASAPWRASLAPQSTGSSWPGWMLGWGHLRASREGWGRPWVVLVICGLISTPSFKGCWDLFGEKERFPAVMLRSTVA